MEEQIEENVNKIGFEEDEAANCTRWKEEVRAIAEGMRCVWPPSTKTKPTGLKLNDHDNALFV